MKIPYALALLILGFLALVSVQKVSADVANYSQLINGELSGAPATEELKRFSKEFKNRNKSNINLYKLYKKYIHKIGVTGISNVLESDNPSCHGVAHSLGKLVGESVDDLNTGMSICASTCTYGCLHGVFKVYFSKLGKEYHKHHEGHHSASHKPKQEVVFTKQELNKFSKDVNDACSKSNSVVDGFYKGNCAHGVGHAMAKLAQKVALANDYCKVFTKVEMQYYCETGVFMELASQIKKSLYPNNLKRSEEIEIAIDYCNKASNYPSACFRFVLPRNKSMGQIFRYAHLCSKQQGLLRTHCFNSLGYHSRTYIARNPGEFKFSCTVGDQNDQNACIAGVGLMKIGQKFRKDINAACQFIEGENQQKFCDFQTKKYYYQINNEYFAGLMETQ